jgi:hypothetical protein
MQYLVRLLGEHQEQRSIDLGDDYVAIELQSKTMSEGLTCCRSPRPLKLWPLRTGTLTRAEQDGADTTVTSMSVRQKSRLFLTTWLG